MLVAGCSLLIACWSVFTNVQRATRNLHRLILQRINGIIRRFLGDGDVVRMAFGYAGGADADEAGISSKRFDVFCGAVSHPGAQAADELIDEIAERAAVWDTALDAFGHQLAGIPHVSLAVAILAA